MFDDDDQSQRFAHIVARAWIDDDFKKRLLSRPAEVLAEYRLELPRGVTDVRIVENTPERVHFILPAPPTDVDHTRLSKLPIVILDTPCHGHETCGKCRHPCG